MLAIWIAITGALSLRDIAEIWSISEVLILNLFFGHGSFCSESAKFEKNLQKIFALSLELKEITPFFFNDILDCLPSL